MLCKRLPSFFNTPHVLNVSSSVNRSLIVVFRLNWKQWITMHQRWKCPHCWIKPHSHFDFNGHHYSPHKTPDNMCSFRNSSRWKTASPYGDEDFNGKNQRHALRQYYMRSIKISQERERRKKSGHFWSGGLKNETPEWPADLWEPPVRIVFRFWHFCFCRQGGFWWERVRQRGQSAARAKPGLWVSLSLSLSLMVCCLVSSEWMPVEARCLQHAHGGLRCTGLVKSPSHQQADSATPWKHLPERQTSLHAWYAQHTPSTWSVWELTIEESLGASGLRIWPCAVKCKLC